MSGNNHDKTNNDTFNLTNEEINYYFGSQLYSQSSNSNNDYQFENIANFQNSNNIQSKVPTQRENKEYSNSSMINGNECLFKCLKNLIIIAKNEIIEEIFAKLKDSREKIIRDIS